MAECTCEYTIDFEDGRGPQHAPGCPLNPYPNEPEVVFRNVVLYERP